MRNFVRMLDVWIFVSIDPFLHPTAEPIWMKLQTDIVFDLE